MHHSINFCDPIKKYPNKSVAESILKNGYSKQNDIILITDNHFVGFENKDIPYFLVADAFGAQITIKFMKRLDKIFIDPENDTDPDMLGWLGEKGSSKFNKFMDDIGDWLKRPQIGTCFYQTIDKNISLFELLEGSDIETVNDIDPLYGFAVKDIKEHEIIAIDYNFVKENMLCDKLVSFQMSGNDVIYTKHY